MSVAACSDQPGWSLPWRARVQLHAMSGHGRRRGRHGPPFGRGFLGDPLFFGPGRGHGGPRARRGDVRTALLLLLAEEPRNGYQLMQEMESRSRGVWRPSPGSVYPALAQLEDEGLVRAEERDGRRIFALTDEGRAQVEERRQRSAAPWDELSGAVDDDVAALAIEGRKVLMAVRQIAQLGSAREIAEGTRVLAETRRKLYGMLAEDAPRDEEEGGAG
jgi:DNA-binding PadR family transcriptional regulator